MSATNNNNSESAPLIILADDDPSIRLVLHHILQRDGYRVLDASNGREVLRLHEEQPANLLLLDGVMPEQDGFVTCRILKEQQPDLPVILITGLDDDQSIEHAFRMGADDYISKPINWSVLKHRVARALSLLTPRNALDERIFNNQIDTRFYPTMTLADETITGLEAHTDMPLSTLPGMPAMEHLYNGFGLGYQQEKYRYPTAHDFSLPLWPVRSAGSNTIDTLHGLEKKFSLQLNQLQLRVHECNMQTDSLLHLLPLLATLPIQLCVDAFSFSLRSLDFMRQHNCKSLMLDISQTKKQLADKTLWMNDAIRIYTDKGFQLHACGVREPDDIRLAISLGCLTASGPAIRTR